MISYTRQDGIRDTIIREKIGVTPIVEKWLNLVLSGLGMYGENL